MVCSGCGSEVGPGARFCSACGRAVDAAMYGPVQARLMRPQQGRVIAGVCAGFARTYGWDVIIVRLVLCLAVVFGAGTPLIAYLIAWLVMPNEPHLLPQTTQSVPPPGTTIP